MEDYTYHLPAGGEQVLGAHMLEVCPSIAAGTPALEVHPLSIGGKQDPVRLVFDARPGRAVNVSLVDLGNRFRLLVNEVEAVTPPPLPKLPVARALWRVEPDFETGVAAWIYAGGAHHTVFSYALTSEHVADFAEIAGVESVVIDAATALRAFEARPAPGGPVLRHPAGRPWLSDRLARCANLQEPRGPRAPPARRGSRAVADRGPRSLRAADTAGLATIAPPAMGPLT